MLDLSVFLFLNAVSVLTVFLLAPPANPNMHLDEKELAACRKTSRIRINLLSAASILLYTLGELSVSKGITL